MFSCLAAPTLTRHAGIHSPILGRRLVVHLLEDAAKVRDVVVSAIGGYFLEGETVVTQHELGAIHPYGIQIIIESDLALATKESGNVIRRESEVLSDALARQSCLEILLHIKTDGLMSADCLPRTFQRRHAKQSQAGMQQSLDQ